VVSHGLEASGQIISRGNLLSLVASGGGMSGVIAAQGNLGLSLTVAGLNTRLGGIVSNGPFSGSVVILGQQLADAVLQGPMFGDYAVEGGILGNLWIDGGLSATGKVVSGGQIGDPTQGTTFRLDGPNCGIIAADGNISFCGHAPGGYVFNDVGAAPGNPNAAAINAIFTNGGSPLALDISGLDLRGLALILLDLQNLKVVKGTLTGPVP